MIPVVPFGLIFGVLAIEMGFSPLETMGMSIIIFGELLKLFYYNYSQVGPLP